MVMSGAVMLVIFAVIFSELYQDNITDKKRILAEDFAYSIQTEFIMAAESKSGYKRTFEIPITLEGFPYDISIQNGYLFVNYTTELMIPQVVGSIKKGKNVITNVDSILCLNC